ncbi:MAG: hypothetical protein KDA83_09150 [Planctomycetales bacterium]|nr:hypothetical protein [Planctomycetales bacterium]
MGRFSHRASRKLGWELGSGAGEVSGTISATEALAPINLVFQPTALLAAEPSCCHIASDWPVVDTGQTFNLV